MKTEVKNCRECSLRSGNTCTMVVDKKINEHERKIKDFTIIQEWCSIKGRNFIFTHEDKIAIITRTDIIDDEPIETIEGYVEIFSGDEPKNYIYQKDREKKGKQSWTYKVINKL